MSELTKSEIKQQVAKYVKQEINEYFRMGRPGFEIVSNHLSKLYGVSEYVVATDQGQLFGFYRNGDRDISKWKANNSAEIIAGQKNKDDQSVAIGLKAKNGNIEIEAPNGDLILRGKTVKIQATGEKNNKRGIFKVDANTEINMESPTIKIDGDTATHIKGRGDLTLLGGTVSIFSYSGDVEISDGIELLLSDGSVEQFIQRIEDFDAI